MLKRGLLLVVLIASMPLHAQQLLHVPDGPRTWFMPEGGGEAVWVGQGGEVGAILDKAVLTADEIVLVVESDARALVIWHGLTSFEVPLSAKGRHELRLAGNHANSKLAVNGQELPNLRGRWLALFLDEKQTQVRTTFKSATYANLKWSSVTKKDEKPAVLPAGENQPAGAAKAARPAEVATSLDAARIGARGRGALGEEGSGLARVGLSHR